MAMAAPSRIGLGDTERQDQNDQQGPPHDPVNTDRARVDPIAGEILRLPAAFQPWSDRESQHD